MEPTSGKPLPQRTKVLLLKEHLGLTEPESKMLMRARSELGLLKTLIRTLRSVILLRRRMWQSGKKELRSLEHREKQAILTAIRQFRQRYPKAR